MDPAASIMEDTWLKKSMGEAVASAAVAAEDHGVRRAILKDPRSSYFFHMADQGSRFTRQTDLDYIRCYVNPDGSVTEKER